MQKSHIFENRGIARSLEQLERSLDDAHLNDWSVVATRVKSAKERRRVKSK
jgi:hypothetical protein